MITLYRTPAPSLLADQAQRVLAELVLAHNVVTVEDTAPGLPAGTGLPAILDEDKVVSGDAIPAYLEELTSYMAEWSRYQSDSCYVDKDNRYC
jgi:hypothetical protein